MIPEFESSVCPKNPTKVTEIITGFIKRWAAKLQVTTDFDMTLSRFLYKGKRCLQCHIIDNYKLVTDIWPKKLLQVNENYYAIEVDPVFYHRREVHFYDRMVSRSFLVEQPLPKVKFKEIVEETKVMFF